MVLIHKFQVACYPEIVSSIASPILNSQEKTFINYGVNFDVHWLIPNAYRVAGYRIMKTRGLVEDMATSLHWKGRWISGARVFDPRLVNGDVSNTS
jgi:hypothetical protein